MSDLVSRVGQRVGWSLAWLEHQALKLQGPDGEPGHHHLADLVAALKEHAVEHPQPLFALLRRVRPIAVLGKMAVVTRFPDVVEVLAHHNEFHVPYARKFAELSGGTNFILGMDDTPAYTRDLSLMRLSVRREDVTSKIVPLVERTAREVVSRSNGRIDLVTDLGANTLASFIEKYFGLPVSHARELCEGSLVQAAYLFLPDVGGAASPELQRKARDAGAAVHQWVGEVIAEQQRARTVADDTVLGRMLAQQAAGLPGSDDVSLRSNLVGLVVGAIPTTVACVALAVDELLRRPDALQGAADAAQADDDRLLARYVAEALRLNPITPGLFRVAAEDYVLAAGTARATRIHKGTLVLASTQSAMLDQGTVDDPTEFRIDRPAHVCLTFGYGPHECFGRYINAVQVPLIVKAILERRNVRRAPGAAGHLTRVNQLPAHMVVECDT